MDGKNNTGSLTWALTRKKADVPSKEKINQVLTLFDLIALGTGWGVYVLVGAVANSIAGPSAVLSFVITAVVSAFSGLFYAELAGRVPKARSAYIYSYVAVGEFIAFVIGWIQIIEYLIGTASSAKAMTNYCDSLLGNPQKRYMTEYFPIHISFLGSYPDFASFVVIVIIALLVAWGVRESSFTNNIFTALNLITVGIVIVTGFYKADYSNWSIPKSEIPSDAKGGEGGFLPFGWVGVTAGAAKCFYGFIGFDSIAMTGEEAKNPKRDIPLAIVASLFLSTIAYCGVASVLTLMCPYYLQDADAPFLVLYGNLDMPTIKIIVTGGAIFALCTSILGTLFPLPCILYAMASDGLLFKFLSNINATTKTPLISTVVCGLFAGTLAAVFNLDQLVDMASIGTLQAYTIVCICVLILRYTDNSPSNQDDTTKSKGITVFTWLNWSNAKVPNFDTQYVSRALIFIYSVCAFVFGLSLANMKSHYGNTKNVLMIINIISILVLLVTLFMLSRLPTAVEDLSFKVPLVPIIPCLSIVLNVYLMMELEYKTWISFTVLLICGLLIYLFYGIGHSLEGNKPKIDINTNQIKLKQSSLLLGYL
ncbi:cationic amino acid transporter 2-like isoform X2 [Metopolophium dirhodum]|uniref:cationic amino acid transporter 2-like isoform X2 n=1 Tax=Metopolophium dirhodum TaxID=44670 RepID=UPI00298FB037|nr:cationic amino acid transporter 2-like isoform X2 [Metopolophium dirhodum]